MTTNINILVICMFASYLLMLGNSNLLKRVNSRIHAVEQRLMFEIQELRIDLESETEVREQMAAKINASPSLTMPQDVKAGSSLTETPDDQQNMLDVLTNEQTSRNKTQAAIQRFKEHVTSSVTHIRHAVSREKSLRKRNARDISSLNDDVSTLQSCMSRELSATETVGSLKAEYIKGTNDFRRETAQTLEKMQAQLERLHVQPNQELCKSRSKNCKDLQNLGFTTSGVYTIYPDGVPRTMAPVYCDMETDGGGWLIFQRRQDGTVDFYRNWSEYRFGFGDTEEEFCLGDSIVGYANGSPFSTKDKDNDSSGSSCANLYTGAWWYTNCHQSNLNGKYLNGTHQSYADGIEWKTWKGYHYSLCWTEMKFRPK